MLLPALILLALRGLLHATANLHYDNFKPIATVPTAATYTASSALLADTMPATMPATASAYTQKQATWPSAVTHNNWFILQATANTAVAAADTEVAAPMSSSQQHRKAVGRQSHSLRLNNYATQINQPQQQQHQPQQQQYSVNYYTYNSSRSGNYHSMHQHGRIVEPYVLAISNQLMSGGSSNGDSGAFNKHIRRGRVHVNSNQNNHSNQGESKLNKDDSSENIAPKIFNNANTVIQDIESHSYNNDDNGNSNGNANVNSHGFHLGESGERVGSVEDNANSLEDVQIDEVLIPLAKVLDKVKDFCELWKQIIGEAGLVSGDLDTAAAAASTAADTITGASDTAARLPAEVQGRRSAPPVATTAMQQSSATDVASFVWPKSRLNAVTASTATASTKAFITTAPATAKSLTSAALVIGRGKKLRKKFKNLMLPLLLAYKLKFFAMVPLLISGLTLLVGSTGLAGFFFALFITVMSLKGGANKSVVIKQGW